MKSRFTPQIDSAPLHIVPSDRCRAIGASPMMPGLRTTTLRPPSHFRCAMEPPVDLPGCFRHSQGVARGLLLCGEVTVSGRSYALDVERRSHLAPRVDRSQLAVVEPHLVGFSSGATPASRQCDLNDLHQSSTFPSGK